MPPPTDRFGRRPRRPLTPKLRAWVVELRSKAPWLALRKIASALGLSLHQVRQALTEPAPPHRIRGRQRCATCGGRIQTTLCVRCQAESRQRAS